MVLMNLMVCSQFNNFWKGQTKRQVFVSTFCFWSKTSKKKILNTINNKNFKCTLNYLLKLYHWFCKEIVTIIEHIKFLYLKNHGSLDTIQHAPNTDDKSKETKGLHPYIAQNIKKLCVGHYKKYH